MYTTRQVIWEYYIGLWWFFVKYTTRTRKSAWPVEPFEASLYFCKVALTPSHPSYWLSRTAIAASSASTDLRWSLQCGCIYPKYILACNTHAHTHAHRYGNRCNWPCDFRTLLISLLSSAFPDSSASLSKSFTNSESFPLLVRKLSPNLLKRSNSWRGAPPESQQERLRFVSKPCSFLYQWFQGELWLKLVFIQNVMQTCSFAIVLQGPLWNHWPNSHSHHHQLNWKKFLHDLLARPSFLL